MKSFLYEKERGRYILAIGIVLITHLIIYKFSTVRFGTNDDNSIINSIIFSSEQVGTESKSFMYIHFLLGLPLSLLYKYVRNVPWYDLYSVVVIAISLIVIWRNILKECHKKGIGFHYAILIILMLQILLFSVPIQQVQFTTTAGVIGTAAIVNYLCLDKRNDFWITWIFMLLCFFQRSMVGYVSLAFLLVLMLSDFIYIFLEKGWGKDSKCCFIWLFLLIISILVAGRLDQSYRNRNHESKEFEEYSDLRVQYMDYNAEAYQEKPEIFESVEWNKTLCLMVSIWYFMDERYNTQNLKKILEHLTKANNGEKIDILKQIYEILKELFANSVVKILCLFVLLLCLCYILTQRENVRKNWHSHMRVLGILGGCLLMILYLCWRGRFPFRVFQTIFMPVNMAIAIILIVNRPKTGWKRTGVLAVGISLSLLSTVMLVSLFLPETQRLNALEREQYLAMQSYVNSHRENVYIYGDDLGEGEPIFSETAENRAYNCFFWGGASMFSEMYEKNLEKNGLSQLKSEDWFRENVYFLAGDGEREYVLYNYLNEKYGNVDFYMVDCIGDIKVVQFVRQDG